MKLLVDGKIKEQKKTPIDTGYFYGYGVFETILIRDGEAVFLKEHLTRLNNGLASIHINKTLDEEALKHGIAMMRCWNGALKVNVSERHTVITVREVTYTAKDYANGARLSLTDIKRNSTSPSVYIKSMNYMDNMLAMKAAKEKGCHDVLFMNHRGQVCETAVANIFFIKENKVITPIASSGLLNGVVRQWLLLNTQVEERSVSEEELSAMDGAFITNSLMGIMRVSQIGSAHYEDHPLIHDLTASYVNKVLKRLGQEE